ncbi:MAG TPA: hypothetical protein VI603_16250, partial [Saprospiraceae bacterium]|nr:hypothetical protein [Saprospiraceae bacterium]
MRLYLLTLLTAFFCWPYASAQILSPVKWNYSSEFVGNDEYDLIFNAKIDKGWTIYSQFLDDGGPIPTSFTFEDSPHHTRIGEVKESDNVKKGHDAIFEMQVAKFSEYAKFTQRIKVKDASQPVVGYLTFMACDHEKCIQPQDIDFNITLPTPTNKKSDAGTDEKVADLASDEEQKSDLPSNTDPVKKMVDETVPLPVNTDVVAQSE